MNKYLSFLIIALLLGCEEEVHGPTSFEGKVVYADDETPFTSGFVEIDFNQYRVGTSSLLGFERILISEDGSFLLEFDQNEDIDYFAIEIEVISYIDSTIILFTDSYTEISGLDCSPYNCDEIEPGKDYKNLLIKVPR